LKIKELQRCNSFFCRYAERFGNTGGGVSTLSFVTFFVICGQCFISLKRVKFISECNLLAISTYSSILTTRICANVV
jgi:hypothetical protein